VRDGDIVTACPRRPTNAITFGNLKDKASAVSKLRTRPAYHADELGTRRA
jgi:hypothetical protein